MSSTSEKDVIDICKGFKNFWGPKDIPPFKIEDNFQQYSKSEKIGKIADWITNQERRNSQKYPTNSNSNATLTNGIYAYIHEDDDETFTTIDSSKPQKTQFQKNRQKYTTSRIKREKEKQQRNVVVRPPRGNVQQTRYRKQMGTNRQNYRFNDRRTPVNYWFRKPSIIVRDTWKLLEEMEFSQLMKLRVTTMPNTKNVYLAGVVSAYDKSFDYIQPRQPISLRTTSCIFPKVPTCEDPIIRELISEATVFASDSILSTLMSCTRSVAPWDIIIHRVANLLFFDKRNDADIELLTVNETDTDPPFDHSYNSPTALSLEATIVNQNYTQQCLCANSSKALANKNPFFTTEEAKSCPSVGYKYKVFELMDSTKIMVRCEYDAYAGNVDTGINIKSVLEWNTKANAFGWRDKLETQRGAIFATEIKNNSNKFSKWAISSILCGDNTMKIGFISRNHFSSNKDHSILGSMEIAPKDLASQIGLSMENAWGFITYLVKVCMALPEGKYVLLKDPHKPSVRLYNVPDSTLNSNDELDDPDDEDIDVKGDEKDAEFLVYDDIY